MTSILTIDRIENDLAVVESGNLNFSIPTSLLPAGVKEGDSYEITFSAIDNSDAIKESKERLERLQKRDSGDDIIDL